MVTMHCQNMLERHSCHQRTIDLPSAPVKILQWDIFPRSRVAALHFAVHPALAALQIVAAFHQFGHLRPLRSVKSICL